MNPTLRHALDHLSASIQAAGIQSYIQHHGWIIPACQTVHFFGLVLLFGIIATLDLRLLGLLKGLPLGQLIRLIPLALTGFVINVITGAILYTGAPVMFSHNLAFGWKMAFIAIAGLNALMFRITGLQRECAGIGPYGRTPAGAKLIAGVSMVLWVGVMFWGRMLPFLGTAF